jgi:energy-coupling factor transporter ATP-binding protein EcfA2
MHQVVELPHQAGSTQLGPVTITSPRVEQAGVTVLILTSAVCGGAMLLILVSRRLDQVQRDAARKIYRLAFPQDLTADQVTAFVRALAALRASRWSLLGRPSVAFEIVARGQSIEHRLRVPDDEADLVLAQLRATVPGARVTAADQFSLPRIGIVRELRLADATLPIRTDEPDSFAASVLHALGTLAADELLIFQLVAFPVGSPTPVPTGKPKEVKLGPGWLRTAARLVSATEPPARDRKALKSKVSEPPFGAVGRVGALSTGRGRSGQLTRRLTGTLHQLDQPGVRLATVSRAHAAELLGRAATPITAPPLHVNARELATLIAWPVGGPTVPGLRLTGGRVFPPAAELSSSGRVLGRAVYPGMERPVAIRSADALMHLLITGPTGSGKSTLLLNLITQDIQAGNGLILIDPGGDLARDVTERIPVARADDLIYIRPGGERVVGLNPLDCALDDAELVADQLLDLIHQLADNWGPVIEETLKATLVLLAATPGQTLVEMPAVLLDAGYRRRVLAGLDAAFAPTVGEFFARYEVMNPGQQAMAASAALNKVTPFLDRRSIRAMLGQEKPTWTMRQVIDDGKILVVALPSGVIGPVAADLIGGVIVTMAWNAALGRQTVSREQRRPVSLVIDELPRFVRGGGASLADILARARGHGMGLVGAVQHIGQVRPDLRAALMSEARNKIILQPAAEDGAMLSRHLPGVDAEDLMTLEARHAVASLVADGRVVAPVTIATLPPPPMTGHGADARSASSAAYGRDRAEVERDIAERRQGPNSGPRRTRRIQP